MDFPPQWRERQCIVTTWTYFSITTLILIICVPYGAILGIVGGSMYTCRCCMPKKNANGMRAAFCIHFFAFAALIVDLVSVIILIALGAFYLIEDCPFRESLCDFRSVVALCVFGGAGLIFFRFVLAFNVFLSMWDYRREIRREEQLEKRVQEEVDQRYKEYQRYKASKKKKRPTTPEGPSTSC